MAVADPPPSTTSRPPFLRHLISLDTAISLMIHTVTKPFLPHFLLLLLELSADFRFSFPVSLSLLLSPHLHRIAPFLFPFLAGLLLDLVLVGLVKIIVRRARPLYNPSMSAVVAADNYSFPSGHSSRVFFVAYFFHLSFSSVAFPQTVGDLLDNWKVGDLDLKKTVVLGVWVWATITAASRILLGRHFVLDVFAGAWLGILEAVFVFRFVMV